MSRDHSDGNWSESLPPAESPFELDHEYDLDGSPDSNDCGVSLKPTMCGGSSTTGSFSRRSSQPREGSHSYLGSHTHTHSPIHMQTSQDWFPYTHFLQESNLPSSLSLAGLLFTPFESAQQYLTEESLLPNQIAQFYKRRSVPQPAYFEVDPLDLHREDPSIVDPSIANPGFAKPSFGNQQFLSHQGTEFNLEAQESFPLGPLSHATFKNERQHSQHDRGVHRTLSHMRQEHDAFFSSSLNLVLPPDAALSSRPRLFRGSDSYALIPTARIPAHLQWQHTQPRRHSAPQPSERQTSPQPHRISRRQCPICRKIFSSFTALQAHALVHSGQRPYQCPHPDCAKTFNVKSNMVRHSKLHAKKIDAEGTSGTALDNEDLRG
ncbi:LAME_0G15368g1_1 [Lachancea meyersii CBS 8951]|uniref:LAME_0G15368g1_1 n=1 Tax=Lachancea meyersii CBS 8951 TaxID=1266667 RepID=A0A1G4KAR0_9SACH|nr:LAME_0G15368g1_1 [Lachancea meyersii CBS 8951]